MAGISRRSFTAGAIAVVSGACGGLTTDDDPVAKSGAPGPTAPAEPPGFDGPGPTSPPDPFLPFAPANSRTPPSVIWSWTTPEQAAEIRRDKVVFTREKSPTMGRGYLFNVLDRLAAKGNAAAERLTSTAPGGLSTGRYGWHNPWATIRGATDGETYGTELLRIEMKSDTWFAVVGTSTEAIAFIDMQGKPVATSTALASFDRVGGIAFDNDAAAIASCSTGSGGGGMIYRELYVGNEQRLRTVSHRTADILATLDANIAELTKLRSWLSTGGGIISPATWKCRASGVWRAPPVDTIERYLASLAFATAPYSPDSDSVGAIVAELTKARFTVDPFTHSP